MMQRWLARAFSLARLLAAAAIMCGGAAQARQLFAPNIVERGRYLAVAADCAACHTAVNSDKFAGGYPLRSGLGIIYSSNITPSKRFGIGEYTERQFSAALREGVRGDGKNLYPAMPYVSYSALSDTDVQALYAYFMQAVAPVERAAPVTALPFPFSTRLALVPWNLMFLEDRRFRSTPGRSIQWNRGAYLVNALAHCGECHTPRGALMQSKTTAALGGGVLGEWFAPDITSDPIHGIGAWEVEEIELYLKTGRIAGKTVAAGPMAEAVTNSLSKLTEQDVHAIAVYLQTVPSVSRSKASMSAASWGSATSSEATLRGASSPPEGASLYSGLCASCHDAKGAGTADRVIPSLFHNSTVGAERSDNLIAVILQGVDRETADGHVLMPGFGDASYVQPLKDAQVASLATYVRETYGPVGAAAVTTSDVLASRQGGPSSSLTLMADLTIELAILAAFALLAGCRWWRKRQLKQRGQREQREQQ